MFGREAVMKSAVLGVPTGLTEFSRVRLAEFAGFQVQQ